jgi:hypothetical protein
MTKIIQSISRKGAKARRTQRGTAATEELANSPQRTQRTQISDEGINHEKHETQVRRLLDYFGSFVCFVVDLLMIPNLASWRLCESNIRMNMLVRRCNVAREPYGGSVSQ